MMKLIHAPRSLLLMGGALFLVVPLAVVTAGIFSRHVWWDLPMRELSFVGWMVLLAIAPLSWRAMMGRRGATESVAVVFAFFSILLVLRALILRGTLQGVWSLTVMAVLLSLWLWLRKELTKPYFDPRMPWFVGVPKPICHLEAIVEADAGPVKTQVARLGLEGTFVFTAQPRTEFSPTPQVELVFRERKIRLKGEVVRQFDHYGSGWGLGLKFLPLSPDHEKDLGDFLNAIRVEGHEI